MPRRKSIGQRLKSARAPELKLEVAQQWAADWRTEQEWLISRLEKAIRNDDYDELCKATGQIKVVTEKRFTAIPNVLNTLSEKRD